MQTRFSPLALKHCFAIILLSFFTNGNAQFENNPLNMAVDNSVIELATGNDANFFPQSRITNFDGDALQSGNIGDDQNSSLAALVNGGDRVTFDWRVSSESGFDLLACIILDQDLEPVGTPVAISGEQDWATRSLSIPGSGPRIIVWAYIKDGSVSTGNDAGWVDNLRVNNTGNESSQPIPTNNAASIVPILNFLLSDD